MKKLKSLWRKREAFSLSAGKKILITLTLCLLTALGLTVLMLFIRQHSVMNMWAALVEKPIPALYTVLFIFLLTAALSFLTRSAFVGSLIPGLLVLILSMINYFKLLITTIPFQYSDFSLMFQLGDIAQLNAASIRFSWHDIFSIAVLILWLFVIFVFSKPLRLSWKSAIIGGGAAAVSFVLVFVVFANALVYKPIGIKVKTRLPSTAVENSLGLSLFLWRSAISPVGKVSVDNYSQETMDKVLSQIEDYVAASDSGEAPSGKKPNIILVLSESFFDVASLDNVNFKEDPLASFKELCKKGVSGTFYAPTIGYGTSNIELNIMSGINPELMNPDENPCKWDSFMFEYLPTIPQILSDNGYYTASLHSFNDSIYVRRNYFYNLGFQETFFSEDFAKIDPEAAAADDYWSFMEDKISGNAYSDDYLADMVIKLYEQKASISPVFLYSFTMEGHSPFTEKRNGSGFDFETDAELTDEARETLGNIAQGLHNSSMALEKLVDYFSEQDEPTILIFFGDHRPGGGLKDNSSVYSQLGLVSAQSSDWTLEQNGEFYSTSCFIWANDESLLPAAPGSSMNSSANFLGLPILEAAGVELPLFWRFLKSVSEDTTFFSWKYYISADGDLSLPPNLEAEDEAAAKLRLMSALLEDAFYGRQYITDKMQSTLPVYR